MQLNIIRFTRKISVKYLVVRSIVVNSRTKRFGEKLVDDFSIIKLFLLPENSKT